MRPRTHREYIDYIRRVKQTSDPRILFPGAIYGAGYHELQSHCRAYIHATEVGGTHPALIEAMGRGAAALFLETEENREVAGEAGLPFPKDEAALAKLLENVAAMDESQLRTIGARGEALVAERYDWERVTDAYERLFERLTAEW